MSDKQPPENETPKGQEQARAAAEQQASANQPSSVDVADADPDPDNEIEGEGRKPSEEQKSSTAMRLLKWVGGAILALAALIALFLVGLNSDAGRRFVITQIEKMEFENGLKIDIGRLDGSLYSEMVIRELKLRDPKGIFLSSPEVRVDWRPFSFINKHVNIKSATAGSITLSRMPIFKETPPSDDPLLPDLDIDIGRLQVDRFIVGEAISGETRDLRLAGKVAIADGRAQISADADTIGAVNGDRLKLLLDAVPEENRLKIDVNLQAPANGVIAGMAGLEQPLLATLNGSGDWKAWNGQLNANLGDQKISDLALTARDGIFTAKGYAQPQPLLGASLKNLFEPRLNVDLTAKMADRKAALSGLLSSSAFRLAVDGGVDLGNNRYNDLNLALDVLNPSAVAPQVRGNGVRLNAALDGEFALPQVDYQLNAQHLMVNDIIVDRLALAGKARVDADQILIPVSGGAAAILGLDSVAGGKLERVRLDGDFAYKDGRLLSDNLRLRSPRIDAKAIIVADFNRAFYTGAIDGRINDYRIESVGVFNIETDVDLKTVGTSGFEMVGNVRARSTQLFNSGVQNLLGGNAVASSAVRYGTDGIIRFSNLRLNAPKMRITSGQGSYNPNGQMRIQAQAQSVDYGPLSVDVTGTISNPRAVLKAERPGLGIGLANLEAEVNGAEGGYRLTATGETDYGPLAANVILLMQQGPLTIDIERAEISGIGFAGRLVQSSAGPFVGQLDASGSGVGGILRLSADGEYQAVKANLRANDVVMPGAANLSIGSAIIDADVTLYDTPHIVADVQIADTRYQAYQIAVGRVKVDYRDGRGKAQALLEGQSGVPFRVAANAELQPQLWRVALQGRASGINFSTVNPARIIPSPSGYELQPTSISLGRGSTAQLSGRYSDKGMMLQSRLEQVNMAVLNGLYPDLGLGGRATGSVDFIQSGNAVPTADIRLTIKDFTRTTAAAVSQPVDVNFVAQLKNDGGDVRAVMRKRGTVVGRLQAGLRPLGAGGDWSARLMAAQLSGGFRYNGPSETLYSFVGPAQQNVSGPIAVAADFSCRVNEPCLNGMVHGKGMTYENQLYGTRLTDMDIEGRFNGDRLLIERMSAKAGDGTIEATGYFSLAAAQGYPMNIKAKLNNAQLARSDNLGARATGDLELLKEAGQTALLTGDLRIPEVRYKYVREGAAAVPALTGVRRKPTPGRARVTGERLADVGGSLFDLIRLDIRVRAGEQIYVSGMGLESEWKADIRLQGSTEKPRLSGDVELIRGTLGFAGRSFELQEGRISFPTGDAYDPAIRLVATETIEDVDVSITVTGRAMNPQIEFSSTPGLPQDEIVSRILFGDSITDLSPIQAVQLAASLNSLRGGGGGLNPLGTLQSVAGIDRLRVLGADEAEGRGTAIAAGQYISKDIYLEIITDGRGYTATQLEISLTRALSILSQAGGSGQTNFSVRYRKDY